MLLETLGHTFGFLAFRRLRKKYGDAVSDATWEIYLRHKAAFAPFTADFAQCHLRVEGATSAAEVAWEIERFIVNHY